MENPSGAENTGEFHYSIDLDPNNPGWKENVSKLKSMIDSERANLHGEDKITSTEFSLCSAINFATLQENRHWVTSGTRSEEFLQSTTNRLALLREVGVGQGALDMVLGNYWTSFSNWRANDLRSEPDIERFFSETDRVGFPQEYRDKRIVELVANQAVDPRIPYRDVLHSKELATKNSPEFRSSALMLTAKIAEHMGISENEFNQKAFDLVTDVVTPGADVPRKDALASKWGVASGRDHKEVASVIMNAGLKLGKGYQEILKSTKKALPIT